MWSTEDKCRFDKGMEIIYRELEAERKEEEERKERKRKKREERKKKKNEEEEAKNGAVAAAYDSSHESDSDEKDANATKKNAAVTVAKKVETESNSDEEKADSTNESVEEEEEGGSSDDDDDEESPKKKAKPNESSEDEEDSSSDDDESESEDDSCEEVEPEPVIEEYVPGPERYLIGIVDFCCDDPIDTIRDNLKEHFARCGNIIFTSFPTLRNSECSSGCAFIEFDSSEAREMALDMTGSNFRGCKIKVIPAWPRVDGARGTGWSWVHKESLAAGDAICTDN